MRTEIALPAEQRAIAKMAAFGVPAVHAAKLPAPVVSALRWSSSVPEFESEPKLGLPRVSARFLQLPDRAELEDALPAARAACTAGTQAACLKATARLAAVAVTRPTAQTDQKLAMAVYAEKLASYPPDVVAQACEVWMGRSPFWPAVSEILKVCEWVMQPRRELVRLIEFSIEHYDVEIQAEGQPATVHHLHA